MAVKNITMKEYNGSGYDELHPKTTPEQIDGVVPVSKGGTGATTASQARTNLGLGELATQNTARVSNGGTGETVRYNSITIQDADNSPWNIDYSACRYYPYLRLVYLDVTGTILNDVSLNKGYTIDMCKVIDSTVIPLGRRALTVAMTGDDYATAYIDNNGIIKLSVKTDIDSNRIISISGFYRV